MDSLATDLKQKIIAALNLQETSAEQISDDMPLFGDGLGLDSIDSLELMVLLDREYGIRIEDAREGRTVFTSVATMAAYIREHRKR